MNETLRLAVEAALGAAVIFLIAWVFSLLRQVNTDPLTGVANRRAWERALRRAGDKHCIAILDVDWFKRVNDEFGIAVGDKVLQIVAHGLRRHAPRGSVIARLGGDEFGILLPDSGEVESLLRLLRDPAPMLKHFNLPPITISVGYARGGADAFERASQSLRDAKQSGRDRIVAAS